MSFSSPPRTFSNSNNNNVSSPPRLYRDTRVFDRRIMRDVLNQSSPKQLDFNNIEVLNEPATVKSVEEAFTCSICISDETKCVGKQLICGHMFHTHCIHAWLSCSTSCPNCRQNI